MSTEVHFKPIRNVDWQRQLINYAKVSKMELL